MCGYPKPEDWGSISLKENGKGSVIKGLLMITQIGISMIVPIFLGAFFGHLLDGWLKTSFFFLVFLLFGILAAFRNIYRLTKPFYAEDIKREQQEQAYWEELRRGRQGTGTGQAAMPDGQPESGNPTPDGKTAPNEPAKRRARPQFCAPPEDADATPKSRREMVEEEFAAWRREKESKQDGRADSAGGGNHDGRTCADETNRNGC